MGIRVVRFEVARVLDANTQERFAEWASLSEDVKRLTNLFHAEWFMWHERNGSRGLIRQWKEDRTADAKASGGKKPKCPVECVPKELRSLIRQKSSEVVPGLHSRVLDLVTNKLEQGLSTRKAARGSFSGWQEILLHNEGLPSTTRRLPIPFDVKNTKLPQPDDIDSGSATIGLRVDRIERDGTTATSTLDHVQLRTAGRGCRSQLTILKRIVSREYKFSGSSLLYNEQKRKWFAMICYQRTATPIELDQDNAAVLRAEKDRPWSLIIGDDTIRIGGDGRDVVRRRRSLLSERWSRNANYRYAGSANKGHGRDRATKHITRLSRAWKDFVNTHNHVQTSQVVRICIERNVGKLHYEQPVEGERESLFLFNAGKTPRRHDSTGWDWFQVASFLNYKCQDAGIHFINDKPAKFGKKKLADKA